MQYKNQPIDFCLLIPCFNNESGLLTSLKSVQYNTANYLVVVVDDGSEIPLSEQKLQQQLPGMPIKLLTLQQNSGITHALNTGLQWILENTNTPYIARLDCNDTCAAERFDVQVQFLNNHADVGLLGSWCIFRKADSNLSYNYKTPVNHQGIIKEMHLRNVFIHPTVMFRAALLKETGLYPIDFEHVEDYALFWKLLQFSKGAVINQFLVTCAIAKNGISMSNRQQQLKGRKRVLKMFGSDTILKMAGLIKINFFMILPYSLLLQLKRIQ